MVAVPRFLYSARHITFSNWAAGLSSCLPRPYCRPGIAFYCGFFPRYNRMMAAHGFVTEASAIAAAWARGDRETAERAVSDAMIDATSVSGTPDQCRARIEAYRQSGIDVPIISPFARSPDARARFAAAIHACAPTAR